ncbi:MAG: hypothetical protein KKA07_16190, partial [Bacteroidetes bacterium]|nr:hypothetical protein [Bacteroidota bacterium]MBU1720605.1 hypothetical protein [Bacteroidota bacterium]
MKHCFTYIIIAFLLFSCKKEKPQGPQTNNPDPLPEAGQKIAILLNEGNYNWGNASLSYYSSHEDKITNQVFSSRNGRPLGDIAQSAYLKGDTAFIAVNNSGKIEAIKASDASSLFTITGFRSPRQIFCLGNTMWVSDLYSDSLYIVDIATQQITNKVYTGGWTESFVFAENKLFVTRVGKPLLASSERNPAVLVLDIATNIIINSIAVAQEPLSAVLASDGFVYVLCSGGYDHYQLPELIVINPSSNTIVRTLQWASATDYPQHLAKSPTGDTLFFLNNGVFAFPISNNVIPTSPIIDASGANFYNLAIDPQTADIYVTDASDYVSDGNLKIYSSAGVLKSTVQA